MHRGTLLQFTLQFPKQYRHTPIHTHIPTPQIGIPSKDSGAH